MQLNGLQSKFIWIRRKIVNNTSITFEQVLDQEKNELTEALILFGEGERVNKALADLEMNRPEFYKFYEAGQQSKQAEIDNLKKRIDDALEKCKTGIRKQGGDYYLELIEGILKGIPNNLTGF